MKTKYMQIVIPSTLWWDGDINGIIYHRMKTIRWWFWAVEQMMITARNLRVLDMFGGAHKLLGSVHLWLRARQSANQRPR